MLFGKSILAIVPARKGSERIRDKNMQLLNGKSLIAWAGDCLKELAWIDLKVLSTDSDGYGEEGVKHGLTLCKRPDDLATGDSLIEDTLCFSLYACEEIYQKTYDVILLIEPTSPTRKPQDVEDATHMLIRNNTLPDSVVTISQIDDKYKGHRILHINDWDGSLGLNSGGPFAYPHYYKNGICYAMTRDCVLMREIFTSKTLPLIIDRPIANIDTLLDLKLAELLVGDNA